MEDIKKRLKELKQKRDLKIGFQKETDFASLMEEHENVVKVIKARTKEDDMYAHWDRCFVYKNGNRLQYDIKGTKSYGDNYHTVEFLANHGGLGWLFGNADYFAFELTDRFICVERLKLLEFSLEIVLKSKTEAKYYIDNLKNISALLNLKNKLEDNNGLETKDNLLPFNKLHIRHRRVTWKNKDITTVLTKEEIDSIKEFEIKKW